jgi:hypothetical protein
VTIIQALKRIAETEQLLEGLLVVNAIPYLLSNGIPNGRILPWIPHLEVKFKNDNVHRQGG